MPLTGYVGWYGPVTVRLGLTVVMRSEMLM
jgi:hypothetical protein